MAFLIRRAPANGRPHTVPEVKFGSGFDTPKFQERLNQGRGRMSKLTSRYHRALAPHIAAVENAQRAAREAAARLTVARAAADDGSPAHQAWAIAAHEYGLSEAQAELTNATAQ